jgi:hypothetical protein
MNPKKFHQWSSLLTNIGVILGLIFVAYELQQNSALMKVQISQARADAAMHSNEQLFNSEFIPTILVKLASERELSEEEWLRYVSWFRASNRNQDNVLHQFHVGMLGDNVPRSVSDFVRDVVASNQRSREAWNKTKVGYSDEYVAFVEAVLNEVTDP